MECVATHLRGFEEDSRSGVVFWIDELSIEFGCYCFIVEEHVLLSALQHIFAGLKRTRDQKLSSGLKSGQLNLVVLLKFPLVAIFVWVARARTFLNTDQEMGEFMS